jgi:hypothetical protein
MSVTIEITIKRCTECRHLSHSGGFTVGEAKPVCDHPKAVNCFAKDIKDDKYDWKHRVIRINKAIPDKCPLKNGYGY